MFLAGKEKKKKLSWQRICVLLPFIGAKIKSPSSHTAQEDARSERKKINIANQFLQLNSSHRRFALLIYFFISSNPKFSDFLPFSLNFTFLSFYGFGYGFVSSNDFFFGFREFPSRWVCWQFEIVNSILYWVQVKYYGLRWKKYVSREYWFKGGFP